MNIIINLNILLVNQLIAAMPINNGLTVKFNRSAMKDDAKQKVFGALFAKIPEHPIDDVLQKELLSKAYCTHTSEIKMNRIKKKMVLPKHSGDKNPVEYKNVINVPVVEQPFEDYKIIVATAPRNVKINGAESSPVMVYVVFAGDTDDPGAINIPKIYFVHKTSKSSELDKKDKLEPLIVIDSNRTVTGLKSYEVAKFIKFKNKLRKRYNYDLA